MPKLKQRIVCDRAILDGKRRVLFQCLGCSKCCADLGWMDCLRISWHFKTLMFHTECLFLDSEGRCTRYDTRPALCRQYECGVLYEG